MHCNFNTTHHHAIKAAKTAPMARPSKRQLAGRSNQKKKLELKLRASLKLRPQLQVCCSEEATGPPSGSGGESDLEVSDSENEGDVEFNQ